MKILFILFGLLISFTCLGQKIIKGIVYDRKEPIFPVVVREVGTENREQTNEKGEFEIKITSDKPTLLFMLPGFESKKIKIKKQKFLKVKMKRQKTGKDIAINDFPPLGGV